MVRTPTAILTDTDGSTVTVEITETAYPWGSAFGVYCPTCDTDTFAGDPERARAEVAAVTHVATFHA